MNKNGTESGERPVETWNVTRGVCRLLAALNFMPLCEITLPNSRRADVMGVGSSGQLIIAEVKSGLADFLADQKWEAYREYCDRFYFAVGADFPQDALPGETGIIVADQFGGAVMRESPVHTLHSSRRKALTLRIARLAAGRLAQIRDPELRDPELGAGLS